MSLKSEICSCCGKEVLFVSIGRRNYVYQIKYAPNGSKYQCSYSCWRKEMNRKNEHELGKE